MKFAYIAHFKKNQWLNHEKLKVIQEKRLRKIINHAYTNVPYYHDLFNSIKIKPSDISTINDLKKLPILTKDEVRKNYPKKIVAKGTNLSSCHIAKTTGSTGVPLSFCFSYKDKNYRSALASYIWLESGANWFDKVVTVRDITVKKSWLNRFDVFRIKNISIYDTIENIVKSLIETNPDFFITYPSILNLIAAEIENKKINFIKPKSILAMSESLSESFREKLYEKLETRIFRHYGSEEFGSLAFECEKHSGYHLITDHVVMEFIQDGHNVNPGKSGEVVVTGLYSFKMPLIRYKLGDIAIPSENKCDCGRGLPLIESIEGRSDDYLILPSGRKISPRMINVIENIPGIQAYKTIQETKKRIVVKLVKNIKFNDKTINEVQSQIKKGCLGEDIEVKIDIVEEIPKEKAGKIRTVVSRLR